MALHGDLARLRRLWRPLKVRKYLAGTDEPALHIGCGGEIQPGWLNVDRYNAAADTYLDARNRFPFKDDSFTLIFTEHMLEHLQIDKVQQFLGEVLRVLKPGGVCRITCPDLHLFASNYLVHNDDFFEKVMQGIEHKRSKRPDLAWVVRTHGAVFMTGVVKEFHGHRWMYDYATLEACLREVGFEKIAQRSFQVSGNTRLANMDNPDREFETLYVEASKLPS
jgi:predicted SAM-dependent methyltransferase